MSGKSDDMFIPITDGQGRVTGIMDRMTADYLASTAPNPTQAVLNASLSRATLVRLVGSRIDENRVFQFDVVRLEVSDPADLSELRECLRIVENPESFGHMMCLEDHRLELWSGEAPVATLALLHWRAIRWSRVWKHDAWLTDPRRFENWLSAHGIIDARESRERDEKQAAEREQCIQRWEQAMPACLRLLWPDRLGDMNPDITAASELLTAAVPDPHERIRVLCTWYGSGAGRWSGFPAYESVVERLLSEYSGETLLAAVDITSDVQILGLARLYAARPSNRLWKSTQFLCPDILQQRMASVVEQQGIPDNINRLRRAFGQTE